MKENLVLKLDFLLNINFPLKSFTLTVSLLFAYLSRMRNLLVTPPRVPLLLSLTTTQKMVGSSAGVPTPSAIHLWRNASPTRGSQAARAKLYYTDNSLLTQNCYRAGNFYFTASQLSPGNTSQCRICISLYWCCCHVFYTVFLFHNNACFVFVANAKYLSFSWFSYLTFDLYSMCNTKSPTSCSVILEQ